MVINSLKPATQNRPSSGLLGCENNADADRHVTPDGRGNLIGQWATASLHTPRCMKTTDTVRNMIHISNHKL